MGDDRNRLCLEDKGFCIKPGHNAFPLPVSQDGMKKILVIDDEEWLREMVTMALQQKGFDVVEAGDGASGIEIARQHLPDLILCDVNMEKVDGYLTLSSLRNEPVTASIPFILMTGLADNAGMRHGMELGADDYLPKPFTLEALYAAVDARLKKVQAVRQEAEKKLADLRDNISLMLPHELRTPLNGILAFGEILASDAANLNSQEVAEMGQGIYDSGKRLERLVENFLIYAQIELLGYDSQKIGTLQTSVSRLPSEIVASSARREAEKNQRPNDLQLQLTDVPVRISPDYLGKIVSELVSNGLKFSPVGTALPVTLSDAGDSVVLKIQDFGRGFQPEHLSRIGAYMQFERKMHEQQGLGLGLAIAKRLIEVHGGSLTVQSQPGHGTTVIVKLLKAA
jgi:signal transduction histidine kinase